jgi:ABC-2 type transport system permease protein
MSQIAASPGQARLLGFAAVGGAFALRAVADADHHNWLNWYSLLGLRATIEPFTTQRWPAAVPAVLTAAALAGLARLLSGRREYGAGLVRPADRRTTRLRLRTPLGLAARLNRSSLLAWTTAVAAFGSLFAAMGTGAVQQRRAGELGGFLGAQLAAGDPAAAYLAYCGTLVGIVASVYGVLTVLSGRQAERAGLTDLVLTTGTRRWAPLAAQAAVAAGGCAAILAVTAALSALITPTVMSGEHIAARAFAATIGQWPATFTTIGVAVLLHGSKPRLTGLAWAPLIGSAFLTLLGQLLHVPAEIRRVAVFGHVPDPFGDSVDATGLLTLTAVGLLLALLGVAANARREVGTT